MNIEKEKTQVYIDFIDHYITDEHRKIVDVRIEPLNDTTEFLVIEMQKARVQHE